MCRFMVLRLAIKPIHGEARGEIRNILSLLEYRHNPRDHFMLRR